MSHLIEIHNDVSNLIEFHNPTKIVKLDKLMMFEPKKKREKNIDNDLSLIKLALAKHSKGELIRRVNNPGVLLAIGY